MYLRGFGLWLASRYSLKAATPARPSGTSKPRLGFWGRTPDLDNACVPIHQQVSPNRWLSLLTRSHLNHHNSEPSCGHKSCQHLLCTEPPLVPSLLPIGHQINAKYSTEALVTSYYFFKILAALKYDKTLLLILSLFLPNYCPANNLGSLFWGPFLSNFLPSVIYLFVPTWMEKRSISCQAR